MANRNDEVIAARAEVDAATTALGARVSDLIDQINSTPGDGLDGPQTEALLGGLAMLRDQLNGMGHNPQQPIVAQRGNFPRLPGATS